MRAGPYRKGRTMSLNWSVGACADYEELVCESRPSLTGGSEYMPDSTNEQRNEDRITTHLVFVTMAVGMNSITAKNSKEFYRRVGVIEEAWDHKLRLCIITGDGEDDFRFPATPVTLDMIERRIGLHTNAVGKQLTKAEFAAKVDRG